jgi:hypothetical protein
MCLLKYLDLEEMEEDWLVMKILNEEHFVMLFVSDFIQRMFF